jgi:hypothetical protein
LCSAAAWPAPSIAEENAMSNRLTHSLRQLHPLRRWLRTPFGHPGHAGGMPHPAASAVPAALEQTRELDAQTGWPTHRIRSFLSTQGRFVR